MVRSLVALARADGQVHAREIGAMDSIIDAIVVGSDERSALRKSLPEAMQDHRLLLDCFVDLPMDQARCTFGQTRMYLHAVEKIILADDEVLDAEVRLARVLVERLGMVEDDVRSISPVLHSWIYVGKHSTMRKDG